MGSDETKLKNLVQIQRQEIQRLKNELATGQKKYRQDRINDQYFEYILANVPCHLYWLDENNIYRGCNDIHAKNAGFKSRHDIVGKKNADLNWKDQAETLDRINIEIMKTGKSVKREESFILNGKKLTFLSQKVPMYENNNPIGTLGISVDITSQKKLEESLQIEKNNAEAANLAKTEFLENMRHDIRTPLTGIVGFSDIIKSEAINPKVIEYSDNLIASSHALLELMGEVLEAIRIGSGEISKNEHKFSLKKTLQHVIDLNKCILSRR